MQCGRRAAAGEAASAPYRQQVATGTVYGPGLIIDTGDSLLNLTVSSPDRERRALDAGRPDPAGWPASATS